MQIKWIIYEIFFIVIVVVLAWYVFDLVSNCTVGANNLWKKEEGLLKPLNSSNGNRICSFHEYEYV